MDTFPVQCAWFGPDLHRGICLGVFDRAAPNPNAKLLTRANAPPYWSWPECLKLWSEADQELIDCQPFQITASSDSSCKTVRSRQL